MAALAAGRVSADVQAHARDHRSQPPVEVLNRVGVGAADPDPRVLNRIVGLARRPEHPPRNRPQPRPVLLELLGEP